MRKNKRILIAIFLIFGVLVAPHEGEFWPFSIFPMFSQAGNPWVRTQVQLLQTPADHANWRVVSGDELPGEVLPMTSINVNQNDVSNFVAKTSTWNERSLLNLRNLFGDLTTEYHLMIYRVTGELDPVRPDSVSILYTPYILLSPDTTLTHPDIERS